MADNLPVQPSPLGSVPSTVPQPAAQPAPTPVATPLSAPTPTLQPATASASGSPMAGMAIVALVILLILAAVGYLFWQGQQLPDQLPSLPTNTEPVEVSQNGFSASPAPSPVATAPQSGEKVTYTLPTGWIENPAEGQLTPEIAFLSRLRSGDACNTVVTALFQTGNMSFNEFVLSQYPGNTLASLQHSVQFSVSGRETFTVKPQGVGESYTVYIQGKNAVHGIFASYSPVQEGGAVCSPEPPSLLELTQSLAVQ